MEQITRELSTLLNLMANTVQPIAANDYVNALQGMKAVRQQACALESHLEQEIDAGNFERVCSNCAMCKRARFFDCARNHDAPEENCMDWQMKGSVHTCDTCEMAARSEKPICRKFYRQFGAGCPAWTDEKRVLK